MLDLLYATSEQIAHNRAKWIDDTIQSNIPEWKKKILLRFPYRFLTKVLFVDVQIVNETLIADFGTEVRIYMNKKLIGSRKYKL